MLIRVIVRPGEPPATHTHPAPCLWAFTRCHYCFTSRLRLGSAVNPVLLRPGEPQSRTRGQRRTQDSPPPTPPRLPACPSGPLHSTPSHCLRMHSTSSICVHALGKAWSLVSWGVIARVTVCISPFLHEQLFLSPGTSGKGNLFLIGWFLNKFVVLASESLLLHFHPTLWQVLELK